MLENKKENRYERLYAQFLDLTSVTENPVSRMATMAALLHHKMDYFFWVGFYLLRDGELLVGPYQGPLACQLLKKDTGVCWAGINQGRSIVVPDVHAFPGHIACDSRSNSEIVVPLTDAGNKIIGVLDADSRDFNSFDEIDAGWLEKMCALIYEKPQ
ncbi:MAG: GAF domain-containing protein [Bacteroidetes bacterium]|nr:GAF domain-containing protein [Bacteroidota bacterium]